MRKLILLIPFIIGCQATMESTYNKNNKNAPINEINGGIVSYLNQGANNVISKRRSDAYKKMHDYCRGPYQILTEGEFLGEGIATPVGDSVMYGQVRHWKIRFECIQ